MEETQQNETTEQHPQDRPAAQVVAEKEVHYHERSRMGRGFLLGVVTTVVAALVAAGIYLVVSDDDDDGQLELDVPAVEVEADFGE